jgi:serine/threonine-protein kinase PknG
VDQASDLLNGLPDEPRPWCRNWHRGLTALVADDTKAARKCFDMVYDWLPGEVSARLGYAVACELDGAMEQARDHYQAVWRTDRAADSAAFGLARALLVAPWPGDVGRPSEGRDQAVRILRQVPDSSHASTAAGIWAVRLLLDTPAGAGRRTSLEHAADIAGHLKLNERDRELLRALVLRAAVDGELADSSILGCPAGLDNLRRELDRTLRSLASWTPDRRRRVALVDLANEYRPESWL